MVSCLGSLVQLCCGEGGALQTNVTGVWGAPTVFLPHWVLPRSRVCAFPVCTAQAPGCPIGVGPTLQCGSSFRVLHKNADSVGPVFCAFPTLVAQAARSLMSSLSPGAVRLIPSAVPGSVSVRTCWVRLVSVLGSWSLAATLLVDVNHPESQEVFD